ncbi:MAG: hypothetical protein QOF33_4561 [Thermomicrobiales bacterium]|nr:hypothetical protein [Thermomicrobiales bacterium]
MALTLPQEEIVEPPVWPSMDDAALDTIRVDYNRKIDYLYVFLYGKPLPAVWDPRPDGNIWIGLRLVGDDDWVDEVVGIMVAHFRRHAVRELPRWGKVLTATGSARRESLRGMIADVAAMPVNDEAERDVLSAR